MTVMLLVAVTCTKQAGEAATVRRCTRRQAGSCQNYGPFVGTLNIRCSIILGTQKGTLILTRRQAFSR